MLASVEVVIAESLLYTRSEGISIPAGLEFQSIQKIE